MKKILLIISLSLSLITNVFAQTGAGTLPLPEVYPKPSGSIIKGLGALLAAKEAKKVIGSGLGFLTIAGVSWGIYEVKAHPEKVENYLQGHPDYIPTVVKMVSKYDWGQKYLYNIGVGEVFIQQQLALEKTIKWDKAEKVVKKDIVNVAENMYDNGACDDPLYAEKVWTDLTQKPEIFENSSTGTFANSFTVNQTGNIIEGGGIAEFDVNSYNTLDFLSDPDGLDNDHVPAKATVKNFLNDKFATPLTGDEVKNLYKNLTAIAVSHDMLKEGRTWFWKNAKLGDDWQDLKKATIKDLTNHYLYVVSHHLNANQFIASSIVLWNRNRALCLYR